MQSTPTSTCTKAELLQKVLELKLADDVEAHNMTKSDLSQLLRSQPASKQTCEKLKLQGFWLKPTAMTAHPTTNNCLFVFDASTSSLWQVAIISKRGKLSGEPKLLCNLPVSIISQIAAYQSVVMMAAKTNGVYKFDTDTASLNQVLDLEEDICVDGISVSEDKVVISDSLHGVLYLLSQSENKYSRTRLSGLAQSKPGENVTVKSRDGLSKTSLHAQPSTLCIENKSIFVCDRASNSIRLVTSISSLLKYHKTIQTHYQSFNVHSGNIGYRDTQTTSTISHCLKTHNLMYQEMLSGVRASVGQSDLKPNGSHGSLPYGTIEMFSQLSDNYDKICLLLHSGSNSFGLEPQALLSIPCEHLFSQMRSRYQMPTVLQYCDLLTVVIDETVKKSTFSCYHYYTSKKSYYPHPQLKTNEQHRPSRKRSKQAKQLSSKDLKLLLHWRQDCCAGNFNRA